MYTELFSAKISLVHTTLNISSNITKGVLLLSSKNAWKSEKQVAIKIVQEKEWGHVIESIFSKLLNELGVQFTFVFTVQILFIKVFENV